MRDKGNGFMDSTPVVYSNTTSHSANGSIATVDPLLEGAANEATQAAKTHAKVVENALLGWFQELWYRCFSETQRLRRIRRQELAMYRGDWRPTGGPFNDVYLPKSAPYIRDNSSDVTKMLVPNPRTCDFFSLLPQSGDFGLAPPQAAELARAAEAGVRAALIACDFATQCKQAVFDAEWCGDGYLFPHWDWKSHLKRRPVIANIYKAFESGTVTMDDLQLLGYEVWDGGRIARDLGNGEYEIVPRVDSQEWVRIIEKDSPAVRRINPFDLVATEMDRPGGVGECDGFFEYLAHRMSDLEDGQLRDLGDGLYYGCYANVDNAREWNMDRIPSSLIAVDGCNPWGGGDWSNDNWRDAYQTGPVWGIKRLSTLRYVGRWPLQRMMAEKGYSFDGPEWAEFCEAFGLMDSPALRDRRTWIIEVVGGVATPVPSVVVRAQPAPWDDSKGLPITHYRKYTDGISTHGWGSMRVAAQMEIILNWYRRLALAATENAANPQRVVRRGQIEMRDGQDAAIPWNEPGYVYIATSLLPAGAKLVETVDVGAVQAAEAAREGEAMMERDFLEQTEFSKNTVGQVSGSNFASENKEIDQSSEDAKRRTADNYSIETAKLIQWVVELFSIFTEETRDVWVPAATQGQANSYDPYALRKVSIPVEAWFGEYFVAVTSPLADAERVKNLGTINTLRAAFQELGVIGSKAKMFAMAMAENSGLPGAVDLVGDPPPPPPPPSRLAGSYNLSNQDALPVQMILFTEQVLGRQLTEQEKQSFYDEFQLKYGNTDENPPQLQAPNFPANVPQVGNPSPAPLSPTMEPSPVA